MLARISETQIHYIRWFLAISWLLLIFSLFYDPISLILTDPNNLYSPLRIHLETCVLLQDQCLPQKTYGLGARIFWGAIVPAAIFIVFVFGHETWRRICPLSFFSQLARALKIQRKRKIIDSETGIVSHELVRIDEKSWLGRNHLYLQFTLLFLGLTARLLIINSHRTTLGIFLVLTILSAVLVGYLYAGKSWCNYFCPFSPVQSVFTGPRGLLDSQAHQQPQSSITQSICRTIDSTGQEKSACVACKSPCIDIDAEKMYWEELNKPARKFIQYGYVGLLIGFFLYFYLYAGNWNYYFSGIWSREDSLGTLWKSGLYLFGRTIPIPKLIAAPLILACFTGLSYSLLSKLEKVYRTGQNQSVSTLQSRHIVFTFSTLFSFWFFFIFGGRPFINSWPIWMIFSFNALIFGTGILWFYRTIRRTKEQYQQEELAPSLRRQLAKLPYDFEKILEGRSLNNLESDVIYFLMKFLPEVTKQDRLKIYKGIVKENLEAGKSLIENQPLQALCQKLGLTHQDHEQIIEKLGQENPELFYSQTAPPAPIVSSKSNCTQTVVRPRSRKN